MFIYTCMSVNIYIIVKFNNIFRTSSNLNIETCTAAASCDNAAETINLRYKKQKFEWNFFFGKKLLI